MKTTKKILTISTLMYLLFAGIGCGPAFEAIQPNTGSGTILPVLPCIGSTCQTTQTAISNSVEFKPVSFEEMNSYVAIFPLNNPTDFKVTVDVRNVGGGRFAGNVKITYFDSGVLHTGTFTAEDKTNVSIDGMFDNGTHEAEFNRWFTFEGKERFTGFFQDNIGAVVLVIEDTQDFGDAQGGNYLSGSVWYRNFAVSQAPNPFQYRKCWFVYQGPYMCRSSVVINKSGIEIDGYRKLGTFQGMSRMEAFK